MPGEPRLYGNGETDLITKTWHKFNKVSRPMNMRSKSRLTKIITFSFT